MTTGYSAQELFELVDDLRRHVEEAYERQRWANDAQFAQSYEQLAAIASASFRDDPIIALLQVSIPPELDALIRKDPSCLTAWVRMQLGRLAIRLSQLARRETAVRSLIDLDLSFMQNDSLREIVANDFTEAQRSYYANAPKAAAILCGSVLEGMLLDALEWEHIESDERVRGLLQSKGIAKLDWNKASLTLLLDLAHALDCIHTSTLKLATSARDFRDTVHPKAEQRERLRAHTAEANVLISVVSLLAADLRAMGARGEGASP